MPDKLKPYYFKVQSITMYQYYNGNTYGKNEFWSMLLCILAQNNIDTIKLLLEKNKFQI